MQDRDDDSNNNGNASDCIDGKISIWDSTIASAPWQDVMQSSVSSMDRCGACMRDRRTVKLWACGGCNRISYCSVQCQASHKGYHSCHADGARDEGLTAGLYNLGNTCYMNAVIQCMCKAAPLARYFVSDWYRSDINPENKDGTGGKFCLVFAQALKRLWFGGSAAYSPVKFKRAVGSFLAQSYFYGARQHDAHELLTFMLDTLHEDVNRAPFPKPYVEAKEDENASSKEMASIALEADFERDQSFVRRLFGTQVESAVTCPECGYKSRTFSVENVFKAQVVSEPLKQFIVTVVRQKSPVAIQHGVLMAPQESVASLATQVGHRCGIHEEDLYVINVTKAGAVTELSPEKRAQRVAQSAKSFPRTHRPRTFALEIVRGPADVRWTHSITKCYARGEDGVCRFIGWPLLLSFAHSATTCRDLARDILKSASAFFHSNSQISLVAASSDDERVQIDCGSEAAISDVVNFDDVLNMELFVHPNDCVDDGDTSKLVAPDASLQDRPSGVPDLASCFSRSMQPERLDQNNGWRCTKCKKEQCAIKTMTFHKLPGILVIYLKRFVNCGYDRFRKVRTRVHFPIRDFDVRPFMHSFDDEQETRYDLFGVVNHIGTMQFGHYTAYVLSRGGGDEGSSSSWLECDDSCVRPIDDEKTIVTPDAYILFYRRKLC